ncbi:MAG: type II toxin-antitoxin system RelE/ParE family toxin [Chloroflexi bacterium]|nr:type II toxin-antitoxin system RelE/ParE family toxin [Chloroflexota bacterium]
MSWEIVWTRPAVSDLRRLDRQVAERIRQAVRQFAVTGRGDVRKLQGSQAEWRLRVGDWRVRFVYDYEAAVLRIVRVLPRGRAYRD